MNTIARSATPYLADTTSSSASFAAAATKVVRASVALHVAVISIGASEGEHFFIGAEVAQMNAALTRPATTMSRS